MNNTIEDEIINIEPIGIIDMIDIEVSDNHLFFANDILTHNSAAKKESPGMDATSESIGLPFTVDAQFTIWSSDEDKQLGITHMGINKSRFGVNHGHTNLKIIYETMTIEEFPENVTTIDSNDINSVDSALDDFNKKVG